MLLGTRKSKKIFPGTVLTVETVMVIHLYNNIVFYSIYNISKTLNNIDYDFHLSLIVNFFRDSESRVFNIHIMITRENIFFDFL